MSVDEELHGHAEHAKQPFDKKVAVTMAIVAAMLAVFASMAILTKRNLIWYASIASALVGLVIALSRFMVHA